MLSLGRAIFHSMTTWPCTNLGVTSKRHNIDLLHSNRVSYWIIIEMYSA